MKRLAVQARRPIPGNYSLGAGTNTSPVYSGFFSSSGGCFLAGALAAGAGCCSCFAAGWGVAGLASAFGVGSFGVAGFAGCGRAAGSERRAEGAGAGSVCAAGGAGLDGLGAAVRTG